MFNLSALINVLTYPNVVRECIFASTHAADITNVVCTKKKEYILIYIRLSLPKDRQPTFQSTV